MTFRARLHPRLRVPLRTGAAAVATVAVALTATACEDDGGGGKDGAAGLPGLSRSAGTDGSGGYDGSGGSGGSGPGTTGGTGTDSDTDNGTDSDSGTGDEAPTRNGGTSGGPHVRQKRLLDNLPRAGSVMAAGEYVQRFTTCERYSIDPSDERYYPMDEKFDASWGVQFRGTCGDGGHGWIRVFKTSDMRRFQAAYKADLAERVKKARLAGIDGGFAVGKDFAVIAPDDRTIRQLSASGLLMLNCNPDFQPVGDVTVVPALVDGCVLTDDFIV
ncbi:hypothetical protein AB0I16_03190 [Streptomyces sp. NPDC050703]|uniref:hypothetical protein n=1 Tax=Streptomyces sp. NPDC050703 TaxID=3157218 RepID=UPI00341C079E